MSSQPNTQPQRSCAATAWYTAKAPFRLLGRGLTKMDMFRDQTGKQAILREVAKQLAVVVTEFRRGPSGGDEKYLKLSDSELDQLARAFNSDGLNAYFCEKFPRANPLSTWQRLQRAFNSKFRSFEYHQMADITVPCKYLAISIIMNSPELLKDKEITYENLRDAVARLDTLQNAKLLAVFFIYANPIYKTCNRMDPELEASPLKEGLQPEEQIQYAAALAMHFALQTKGITDATASEAITLKIASLLKQDSVTPEEVAKQLEHLIDASGKTLDRRRLELAGANVQTSTAIGHENLQSELDGGAIAPFQEQTRQAQQAQSRGIRSMFGFGGGS